ncbi:MAG: glycoside hydrolase family 76 protein [Tepidisphaeraceae bacterium]
MRGSSMILRWKTLALGMLVVGGVTSSTQAALSYAQLRSWGVAVANEIDRTLRVPGTALYAETASLDGSRSGGIYSRAFVWPVSTQFRVMNMLARHDPTTYTSKLRTFSEQVHTAYYNAGYRSGAGSSSRFYDDNGHMLIALAEAYQLTGDSVYLDRAKLTYNFVLSGEDSAGGGGIYFQQGVTTSKDTISTLQAARGAAMLYQITGQASYLTDATRLRTWANSHVQLSNGLYNQGFVIASNSAAGVDIVNAAGDAISMNLELYDATKSATYLLEARRIAASAVNRFVDSSGHIGDEGYWAYELVDALADLYKHDHDSTWLVKLDSALNYLHTSMVDPNGHYGLFWARNGPLTGTLSSWNLNEQAPVARAYLYTATAVPEPTVFALMGLSAMSLKRRR